MKIINLLSLSLIVLLSACKSNQKFFNSGEAQIQQINNSIVLCADNVISEIKALGSDDYTIFFLTRHAEKITTGSDPELLPEGKERARRLATILEMVPLDIICASPYKRTRATVAVCADSRKMGINEYNPNPAKQNAFFTKILSDNAGSRVLVVGHSNSIPDLLNFFVQDDRYEHIADSDYDNFYIVAVKEGKAGRVWSFKY